MVLVLIKDNIFRVQNARMGFSPCCAFTLNLPLAFRSDFVSQAKIRLVPTLLRCEFALSNFATRLQADSTGEKVARQGAATRQAM